MKHFETMKYYQTKRHGLICVASITKNGGVIGFFDDGSMVRDCKEDELFPIPDQTVYPELYRAIQKSITGCPIDYAEVCRAIVSVISEHADKNLPLRYAEVYLRAQRFLSTLENLQKNLKDLKL